MRLASGRSVILVPVPLDRSRLRRRGFNQAALLAAELGRATGMGWRSSLGRLPAAHRQAELGRADRATNVRFGFRWRAEHRLPVARVLLVDDVLTTGATAAACARVIGEAGYDCRGVVTFARALYRPDES